jgi:hypothetical protein
VYFVAHGFGSNASGGGLEVEMTGTTSTGIEGVAMGHKKGRHAMGG